MPLYEYECDACGHRFEVIQKFSDPPVEKCPKCGSSVHKLMSSPAIQFKGTGWYITDYARKGDAGADGKSKSGDAKASKETTDTAKETKTETSSSGESSTATKTSSESKPASTGAAKKD